MPSGRGHPRPRAAFCRSCALAARTVCALHSQPPAPATWGAISPPSSRVKAAGRTAPQTSAVGGHSGEAGAEPSEEQREAHGTGSRQGWELKRVAPPPPGRTRARPHAPLDDLGDLGLPVRHRLLLGRQVLQLVLQVSVLGCEFIHKGAELK